MAQVVEHLLFKPQSHQKKKKKKEKFKDKSCTQETFGLIFSQSLF
jgi:hypothetical protein